MARTCSSSTPISSRWGSIRTASSSTTRTATTDGVEAFQDSLGETETGELTLGQIVFLPGDQLISAVDATLGSTGGGSGAAAASTPVVAASSEFVNLKLGASTTTTTTPTTATTTTTTTPTTTTPTIPTIIYHDADLHYDHAQRQGWQGVELEHLRRTGDLAGADLRPAEDRGAVKDLVQRHRCEYRWAFELVRGRQQPRRRFRGERKLERGVEQRLVGHLGLLRLLGLLG
ncbi:MAG: hypothetical protein ACLP01_01350 [Solirubrobacteraceae bacterium]